MQELLTPQGPADAPGEAAWPILALLAAFVVVVGSFGRIRRRRAVAHLERIAVDWEREETGLPAARAAAAKFVRPALRLLQLGG